MGKRWTTDDMATLRTMYVAGIDYGEIGRVLKRTPSACQQRTHKMGLPAIRKEQQAKVTLTKAELQMAKNVGLTPEQYAHGVILAEAARNPHVNDTLTTQDTEFRESPKNQIKPSKPKPAWWSAMMWWRK